MTIDRYLKITDGIIYKILFCTTLFCLAINFQIAGVYISFLPAFFLAVMGMVHSLFGYEYISKKRILIAGIMMIGFFVSFTNFTLRPFLTFSSFADGWIKIFVVFGAFLYTYDMLKKGKIHREWILKTFLVFTVVYCILFILRYWEMLSVLDSNVNRPNPQWAGGYNQFASILSLGIVILVSYPKIKLNSSTKAGVLGLMMFCLLATLSRGGLYSCLLALLLFGAFKIKKKSSLVIILIFTLGIGGFLFASKLEIVQSIGERFISSVTSSNIVTTTSGRNDLWTYTLSEIDNRGILGLIFGLGVGTYRYSSYVDPHNMFFHIQWEFGLFGLIMFLVFYEFLTIHSMFVPQDDNSNWTLLLILVIIAFNLLVEGYQYSTQTGWLLGIFLGATLALRKIHKSETVGHTS